MLGIMTVIPALFFQPLALSDLSLSLVLTISHFLLPVASFLGAGARKLGSALLDGRYAWFFSGLRIDCFLINYLTRYHYFVSFLTRKRLKQHINNPTVSLLSSPSLTASC